MHPVSVWWRGHMQMYRSSSVYMHIIQHIVAKDTQDAKLYIPTLWLVHDLDFNSNTRIWFVKKESKKITHSVQSASFLGSWWLYIYIHLYSPMHRTPWCSNPGYSHYSAHCCIRTRLYLRLSTVCRWHQIKLFLLFIIIHLLAYTYLLTNLPSSLYSLTTCKDVGSAVFWSVGGRFATDTFTTSSAVVQLVYWCLRPVYSLFV